MVCPIPQKGWLTDVANWRPIVLLPVISRILEGVMTRQLRNYLEAHNLIHHSQHAYREARGCLSCWADLDTAVCHARDQGKAVGLLQTDMTSAFNCANTALLIPKLRLAGVGLESCKLVLSCMTQRTLCVKIDYFTSEPLELQTGSGEGTQISPLIWLVFILDSSAVLNRVQTILESRSHPLRPQTVRQQNAANYRIGDKNYADDINTLCVARTNTEILEIMKVVEQEYGKYFRSLGLKESKAKEMHIIFSRDKNSDKEFKLNDRISEKSTRLLGVTVTEDWTFDEHASKVCQRMMERIPHIRAIRENVSRKVLSGLNAQHNERLKKGLHDFFRGLGFGIKLEVNKKIVDFLDVTLNLTTGEYKEYCKPHSNPVYVNRLSNHPPAVIKNIQRNVNDCLNILSSDEKMFNESKPKYREALKASGYSHDLKYEKKDIHAINNNNREKKKRSRKRQVWWFNPPWDSQVASNVGAKFLSILDRTIPCGHVLYPLFNRHTVKISYRCLGYLGKKVLIHNNMVFSKHSEEKKQRKRVADECASMKLTVLLNKF